MNTPLIVANWKSHKNTLEAKKWFEEIAASAYAVPSAEVVLCPPFQLLPLCKELIKKYQLNWKLGAQDVSPFPEGKHTGEVNAGQLRDFVDYILVGHSERREEFKESDEILFEKAKRVQEVGLEPIFFVQGEQTPIPEKIRIVAYEPVFAIGTGHPDTPENAEKVAKYFREIKKVEHILYGGSVDEKNISLFLADSHLSGVVPGTASLDPVVFSKLIHHA